MAKTSNLNIRIEPEIKASAQEVLAQIGLTTSEAVNLFLIRVSKEKEIPFKIKIPNDVTKKALDDSRAGRNMKKFNSPDELFEDLDK